MSSCCSERHFQRPSGGTRNFGLRDGELLSSGAAELHFGGEIGVHQGGAAVLRGTYLLRGDSGSAAQICAGQVRAIEFHTAQDRAREKGSAQIRFFQIRIEQNRAFENRAGQIRFPEPG